MVLLSHLIFGACTFFQAVSALPAAPLGAEEEIALAARANTRTVTQTAPGTIHTHPRTHTYTFSNTHTRTTKPHTPTHTKPAKSTKSPTTKKTTKPTSPTTTPTPPPTTTKTTTTTTTKPTQPTGNPSAEQCNFFQFGGGEYTTSAGRTYKIECGFSLALGDIAVHSAPTFGSCFALCDANSACKAFTWTPGAIITPAQCFLKSFASPLVPSLVTDSAILIS